jgi:trans-aconitate 2-methyltransferase
MWDPGQYDRFSDERSRPFFDLVGSINAGDPRRVTDLGCGTGTLTAALLRRWPEAVIEGIDSSPDMIALSAAQAVPGRLTFRCDDLRRWRPPQPVDVIVSNAALQWVPGHLDLLPALVASLAPGGWLAFQVPGNFDSPSHSELARLQRSERWRDRLGGLVERLGSRPPAEYLERLLGLGCSVQAWETTYLHVLEGPDPVLAWTKGTALRPTLAALGAPEREEFLGEYAAALRAAYPPQASGTVYPFRRVFVVAQKAS